jgi:lysophospholipase L1-like esterase
MRHARLLSALTLGACVSCNAPDAVGPSSPSAGLSAAARGSQSLPAKEYTLVLGHSLAFGLQPGTDPLDAANFKTGFSTLFVARLNATRRQPHATEINLACPGETTETFIHGGCFYTDIGLPLHTAYTGPQLDAAEAFLRRHRGQVNPIILSLSANDLFIPWLFDCAEDEACIAARTPGAAAAVAANYEVILTRLRRLEPQATLLILVEYQFPGFPPAFNQGLARLYTQVRAAGRAHDAILIEANPIIQRAPCRMLFICDPELPDIHPTNAGYRALAEAVWEASGFAADHAAGPKQVAGVTEVAEQREP